MKLKHFLETGLCSLDWLNHKHQRHKCEFIYFSSADPSPSILVAATSSDSDTEDEALQSSNSCYDNQTPPCTGSPPRESHHTGVDFKHFNIHIVYLWPFLNNILYSALNWELDKKEHLTELKLLLVCLIFKRCHLLDQYCVQHVSGYVSCVHSDKLTVISLINS